MFLDVGCRNNPHPYADVLCDVSPQKRKNKPFVICDGCNLPFKNKTFRHVNCIAVMEHVDEPSALLKELKRVAEHGYVETPSRFAENVVFGWKDHKWVILKRGNKLFYQSPKRVSSRWIRLLCFDDFGAGENEFLVPLGLFTRFLFSKLSLKKRLYKAKEKTFLPLLVMKYSF